jgi:hypothetical protein
MKRVLGALMIAGAMGSGAWAGPSSDRWIHIRVDDHDDGPGRVDIQVPIGMVSGLLPVLKHHSTHRGSLRLDGTDVDMQEIRSYWAAVRDAKDGEYITVRDADSKVRIAKKSGNLLVHVDESPGGEKVRMTLPMALIDAVLAGGDTLDVDALARALEQAPSGELLTVDDGDSHVRIWIDSAPAAAREDAP